MVVRLHRRAGWRARVASMPAANSYSEPSPFSSLGMNCPRPSTSSSICGRGCRQVKRWWAVTGTKSAAQPSSMLQYASSSPATSGFTCDQLVVSMSHSLALAAAAFAAIAPVARPATRWPCLQGAILR